jgi:NAD(P)-dependent dehydrogenase (short-subunit alcohol dehydrogenase family)
LARAATSHGDKVTSVGWAQNDDHEELQNWQDANSIGLMCDVRVRESIDAVVKKSIEHWGRVDVIAK